MTVLFPLCLCYVKLTSCWLWLHFQNVTLLLWIWTERNVLNCVTERMCYNSSSHLLICCNFYAGSDLHSSFALQGQFPPSQCALTPPFLPPSLYQFDLVGSNCVCSHTCTPFYPHYSHSNMLTDSCTSKICSLWSFHGYHLFLKVCVRKRESAHAREREGGREWVSGSRLCCGANLDDWPWNASWDGLPCVPLKWPVPGSVM